MVTSCSVVPSLVIRSGLLYRLFRLPGASASATVTRAISLREIRRIRSGRLAYYSNLDPQSRPALRSDHPWVELQQSSVEPQPPTGALELAGGGGWPDGNTVRSTTRFTELLLSSRASVSPGRRASGRARPFCVGHTACPPTWREQARTSACREIHLSRHLKRPPSTPFQPSRHRMVRAGGSSDPFQGANSLSGIKTVQPALIEMWNLTAQTQVSPTLTFQVGYVGQHGTHLMVPTPYLQGNFDQRRGCGP